MCFLEANIRLSGGRVMEIPEAIRCLYKNNPMNGSDFAEACDMAIEALETIQAGVVPKEFHEKAMDIQYERLRAPQRWIPVSERLPDEYAICLCVKIGGRYNSVVIAQHKGNNYWMSNGLGVVTVSHWMPLPEPPGVE